LKIHHALKETSYLTDASNIAYSAAMAITIGNYLFAANPVASITWRFCFRKNFRESTGKEARTTLSHHLWVISAIGTACPAGWLPNSASRA
jgi:hypothetical protein